MEKEITAEELKQHILDDNKEFVRDFCEQTHPGRVAELLSTLETKQTWDALKMLDIELRALIFCNFELERQVELSSGQNRKAMAMLIEEMPADDRADLIKELDEKVSGQILPLIAKAEREDIRKLVQYKEGTAGSVMSTDYATLPPDVNVETAIELLRAQAPDSETIYYIYVVDRDRKLIGFVSLKNLIVSRKNSTVRDIMQTDIIYAGLNDDQEEIAKMIEKYDLLAIPIVDQNNMMTGIVTHDDALDIIRQEQTEDIEKFMAIRGTHQPGGYIRTPAFSHLKKRIFWVIGLALIGFVSGTIIHSFEDTLASLMLLALYIPMLTDTGGNTGSQSATVVIRALAMGEIRPIDYFRVVRKEVAIGLMMALVVGGISFARVMFLSQSATIPEGFTLTNIGFAIGLALSIQVVTSTFIGASLPLVASGLKLDPAVVASPALTTFVDITGLVIYFTTAKILLGI